MAFALKQRKRRCRVNILNRHHASLCEPPPRHKLSWKYGVFAPLLHCNRNCLSWSLLFDVSHNTRSASPSPFPRAINIPLLSLPAVLHVATSRNARHSPGQSGDPKQKETERRAFELNYFHFRTRSASLFVLRTVFIGMQLPRGGLVSGHGCRPCIRLSLSLWLRKRQWKRGEGFEVVFVRGGVNRRRPFRCRCPLPFHASFRLGLIFSYFKIIMYDFLN